MRRKTRRSQAQMISGDPFPNDERRIFCRFAMKNVPMRYKDLKAGERGSGVCKDFSGGGVSIELYSGIKHATPLEMWFELPDNHEPMHLLGKVAWSERVGDIWRTGVSFERQRLISMARVMKSL
jgi:hypothetical protein